MPVPFMFDPGAFAGVPGAGAADPEGLDLAEETIDEVITLIESKQQDLAPQHFATRGHINAGAFGGADSAPSLALHYSRAHEVITDTLEGVKKDLVAFQQACRDAKQAIVDADGESADRMRVAQAAVERLAVGAHSNEGEHAYDNAQQHQHTDGQGD